MRQEVLKFIIKNLNEKKINDKNLKKNYFKEGIIDSFQLMLLISNLEKNYKIKFSNKDFESKNFFTLLGISNIVDRKLKK